MARGGRSVSQEVRVRSATAEDWPAIARLQTETWRFAYRGILTDAYLDGELADDRNALWQSRFAGLIPPGQITVLAEPAGGGEPLAFACILAAHDRWGSLVDNLHVSPKALRRGLGGRVLNAAAEILDGTERARLPVHLTVYEQNTRAIAAYDAYGGRVVEHPTKRQPDGRTYQLRRYLWDDARTLITCLRARNAVGSAAAGD
jgi:ribosomal protein S18 acetylase RimI-like enzyme